MGWFIKNQGWRCEGRISYPWMCCAARRPARRSMWDIKYGYRIQRAASDVVGQVRDFYLSEGHS
jgi:hypothetical protein